MAVKWIEKAKAPTSLNDPSLLVRPPGANTPADTVEGVPAVVAAPTIGASATVSATAARAPKEVL